jgi:hypothetical protein
LSSFSSIFLASSIGNLGQPEKEGEGSVDEDSLWRFREGLSRLLNLVFSGFVRRRLPIPARAN